MERNESLAGSLVMSCDFEYSQYTYNTMQANVDHVVGYKMGSPTSPTELLHFMILMRLELDPTWTQNSIESSLGLAGFGKPWSCRFHNSTQIF